MGRLFALLIIHLCKMGVCYLIGAMFARSLNAFEWPIWIQIAVCVLVMIQETKYKK